METPQAAPSRGSVLLTRTLSTFAFGNVALMVLLLLQFPASLTMEEGRTAAEGIAFVAMTQLIGLASSFALALISMAESASVPTVAPTNDNPV